MKYRTMYLSLNHFTVVIFESSDKAVFATPSSFKSAASPLLPEKEKKNYICYSAIFKQNNKFYNSKFMDVLFIQPRLISIELTTFFFFILTQFSIRSA